MSTIKPLEFVKALGIKSLVDDILLGKISPMSLLGSAGKSGAFFFYSKDRKYMIKAIPKREFNSLNSIIRSYYEHIRKNRNSFLVRFFGCYKIQFFKKNKQKKILYIVVMNNILLKSGNDYSEDDYDEGSDENCCHSEDLYDIEKKLEHKIQKSEKRFCENLNNIKIKEPLDKKNKKAAETSKNIELGIKKSSARFKNLIFDLKGSTYKRYANLNKNNCILKDMDFIKKNMYISLSQHKRNELIKNIYIDVKYLENLGLIDYSLLLSLTIPIKKNLNISNNQSSSLKIYDINDINDIRPNESFRVGIIDFLTKFTCIKKAEYLLKRSIYGKGISCIPPKKYSRRFLNLIREKVFVNKNVKKGNNKKKRNDKRETNILKNKKD